MKSKVENTLLVVAFLLLTCNPVVWLLLTHNYVLSAVMLFIDLSVALFVGATNEYKRLKVWTANILFVVGIMVHSELIFRNLCSDLNISNLYEIRNHYYFNKPYLDTDFSNREYHTCYRTNCQGYRVDKITTLDDSIVKCDWLFIGDSYTQGAQVDYQDLYTTKIYRNYPDKIILNAGISGAGLWDEYNYFIDEGSKLKPQKVFLQIGVFNDFMNVEEHTAKISDYLLANSDLYRSIVYSKDDSDVLPLGRWVEPFGVTKKDNIAYNILFKETNEKKEHDKIEIVRCLTDFKNKVENNGGELIVILLPSKEQVSDDLLNDVINTYMIDPRDLDMTYPNRWMDSVTKVLNLDFIDLYQSFRDTSHFPFFDVDEHMNELGHQLVADVVSKSQMKDKNHGLQYVSKQNAHERYPMLADSLGLTFITQDEQCCHIVRSDRNMVGGHILQSETDVICHPMISQTSNLLVYSEGDSFDNNTKVKIKDLSTGDIIDITSGKDDFGCIPYFSHDGKYIAYASWTNETYQIYHSAGLSIYDVENFTSTRIIQSYDECWRPIFSKNDSIIYYIQRSDYDKYFVIKSTDLYTSETKEILDLGFDIWDITLSPSGEYIAFAGKEKDNWDIYLYNINSQKIDRVTNTSGDEWDPSFGESDDELWFGGEFGINNGIYRCFLK